MKQPDAKYPLMLCSPKSRARTHSIRGNQPLLARVDPDDVWMNPVDAEARGIVDGRRVRARRAGCRNAKHGQQWESTLAAYVYPEIGSLSVSAVEPH